MDTDESSEKYNWTSKFVENISAMLVQKGLTQGDLARAAEVTEQTVSDWMTGNAEPKFINVWKVADALDESIDDLVGRKRPGSELLERYRAELLARAEALKQVLPTPPNDEDAAAAGPAAKKKQEPALKSTGKKAKKGKTPKKGRKGKKKTPPKS